MLDCEGEGWPQDRLATAKSAWQWDIRASARALGVALFSRGCSGGSLCIFFSLPVALIDLESRKCIQKAMHQRSEAPRTCSTSLCSPCLPTANLVLSGACQCRQRKPVLIVYSVHCA